MRPCSTTHHSDMDQRYVELVSPWDDDALPVLPPNSIRVRTPANSNFTSTTPGSVKALKGYYMAFLVTTEGTPSQAKWVYLP